MASSLKKLEQVVVGDIIGLVFVIGMELIKAVRYAAMNRILQKKVYLDEATGLPNKNLSLIHIWCAWMTGIFRIR